MRKIILLMVVLSGCGDASEARPLFGQVWDGGNEASDSGQMAEASNDAGTGAEGSQDAAGPSVLCCTAMGITKICPSSPTTQIACYMDGNCGIEFGAPTMVAGKTAACPVCSGPTNGSCVPNANGAGLTEIADLTHDTSTICVCQGYMAGCAQAGDGGVECL